MWTTSAALCTSRLYFFRIVFFAPPMTIAETIERLRNDEPVVIRDKTFTVRSMDNLTLDTGEIVYWAYGKDGMWLSLDPESEETIFFEDLDDELEPEDDTVVYGGNDFEFSYEGTATLKDDDGGTVMSFREFESQKGEVLRIIENESTGDKTFAFGQVLTEEDFQEA